MLLDLPLSHPNRWQLANPADSVLRYSFRTKNRVKDKEEHDASLGIPYLTNQSLVI